MTEALTEKIDLFVNGTIDHQHLMNGLNESEITEVEAEIALIGEIQLAAEMSEVRKQMVHLGEPQAPKDRIRSIGTLYRYLGVAAALVFLVLAYFNLKTDMHPLIQEYANINEGLPSLMGSAESYAFDDAMTYFKEARYQTALDKFSNIDAPATNIGQDTLQYFIGLSHFKLSEYNQSIEVLSRIEEQSSYHNKSIWYLLMSYVALDNKDKVDELLVLILSNPDHPYIEQARSFQTSWEDYK